MCEFSAFKAAYGNLPADKIQSWKVVLLQTESEICSMLLWPIFSEHIGPWEILMWF